MCIVLRVEHNINKLVHTRAHSVAEQIVTCVYFCLRSTNINKLGADLEAAKKEAQSRDLLAENKAKKKKGYVEEFEGNKVFTPNLVCLFGQSDSQLIVFYTRAYVMKRTS